MDFICLFSYYSTLRVFCQHLAASNWKNNEAQQPNSMMAQPLTNKSKIHNISLPSFLRIQSCLHCNCPTLISGVQFWFNVWFCSSISPQLWNLNRKHEFFFIFRKLFFANLILNQLIVSCDVLEILLKWILIEFLEIRKRWHHRKMNLSKKPKPRCIDCLKKHHQMERNSHWLFVICWSVKSYVLIIGRMKVAKVNLHSN